MKGFKDSSGTFHPITDYKGVRKSRDQKAKSTGIRFQKSSMKKEPKYLTVERLRSFNDNTPFFSDRDNSYWTVGKIWDRLEREDFSNDSERNDWLVDYFGDIYLGMETRKDLKYKIKIEGIPDSMSFWNDYKYMIRIPPKIAFGGYMQTMDGDHPIVSETAQRLMEIVPPQDSTWTGNPRDGEELSVAYGLLGNAKGFKRMLEDEIERQQKEGSI